MTPLSIPQFEWGGCVAHDENAVPALEAQET